MFPNEAFAGWVFFYDGIYLPNVTVLPIGAGQELCDYLRLVQLKAFEAADEAAERFGVLTGASLPDYLAYLNALNAEIQ